MTDPVLDIKLIRAASTDAGNRYMKAHPNDRPEGTAVWTREAFHAASSEFHRLCKAAGISPFQLPK